MAEVQTEVQGDTLNIGESTAEEQVQTSTEPRISEPDKHGFYWGTGRRKSAVARVRIKPGSGKMVINDRELKDYFPIKQEQAAVIAPLKAVKCDSTFDVFVNVKGGGFTGQCGATMLGIARALRAYSEDYTSALRDGGYLTRDSRMVERKKYGRRKARRSFQFSKR